MVRPCAGRSRSPARLLAAVGCVVVLALTACGHSSDTRAVVPPPAGSTYTLMQMNLCLSGLGGCYGRTEQLDEREKKFLRLLLEMANMRVDQI